MNTEEKEVLETHDIFWQGLANRDLDKRFSVCSDDITFFGTGQHEHAVGKEQYRMMNEIGLLQYPNPFEINIDWIKVRVIRHVACVECDTTWIKTMNGKPVKDFLRLSTILKKVDDNWEVIHVHGSEPDYRLQPGEFMTNETIFERNRDLERQVFERTKELFEEKQKSDNLLLNILPEKVAEELKTKGTADAKLYSHVTVLFTDFKDFTLMCEHLTPHEIVSELHECFKAFDNIMAKYNIEKIKTIGDGYLAVSGLPVSHDNHAIDIVNAALEIRNFIKERNPIKAENHLDIRIGVHTGEVVAGIVGIKKFAYDIWGDTVNIAARMEQNCIPGKVNISETTYDLIKNKFNCEYRGEIEAKHKGKLKMYFVELGI